MVQRKTIQAKHLPEWMILAEIAALRWTFGEMPGERLARPRYVSTWELHHRFMYLGVVPERVMLAKLRRMQKRGLIDGCFCGCRGDIVLLPKGEELLRSYPPLS